MMNSLAHSRPPRETILLLAEDDDGHAELILENLRDAGFPNRIIRFSDGQETLDFLAGLKGGAEPVEDGAYLLLLDIRMPRLDGVEVLSRIKADPPLKRLPVVMLTTTDDPGEIERCYELGCNCYITKPVDYERFSEMLRRLALFLMVIQVPGMAEGMKGN